MKLFLFLIAATASLGIWMMSVASSQLVWLDQANTIEAVSGAYFNPINRNLKQGRLGLASATSVKMPAVQESNFCNVGGFERACKFKISGLKVSPPLVPPN